MEINTDDANFNFRTQVLELIALSHRLFKIAYQAYFDLNQIPTVVRNLRVYEKIFVMAKRTEIFKKEFMRILQSHSGEIIASSHSDSWLLEGKFAVSAVADIDDVELKSCFPMAILDISKIYRIIIKHETEYSKLYTQEKDKFSLQFMIILLKIFLSISFEMEMMNEIRETIRILEAKRGIFPNPRPGQSSGAFGRIVKNIQSLMSGAGMNIADSALPTEEVFTNTIDSLLSNNLARDVLGKVVTSIKENVSTPDSMEPANLGTAINKIIQDLVTPEISTALAEGIEKITVPAITEDSADSSSSSSSSSSAETS